MGKMIKMSAHKEPTFCKEIDNSKYISSMSGDDEFCVFFKDLLDLSLRERERGERVHVCDQGEGQREREDPKQTLCSAWSPMWGLISQL